MAFFLWSLLVWLSWLLIIWNNFKGPAKDTIDGDQVNPLLGSSSGSNSSDASTLVSDGNDSLAVHMVTVGRFWLGLFLSATLLLGEKIVIQAIAWKFHLVSYADRISTSRFHLEVLSTLFSHSKSTVTGTDLLSVGSQNEGSEKTNSSKSELLEMKRERRLRNGGNSVLASSVEDLLPKRELGRLGLNLPKWDSNPLRPQDDNNPREIVLNALDKKSETVKLARRIFFSFAISTSTSHEKSQDLGHSESPLRLRVKDIQPFFPDSRISEAALTIFDKDLNGDCTLEEVISACLEVRLERKTLSQSMRDVDSAVGNLDGLFMSVFLAISIVIIAALISTKFSTLITGFGSAILGLSWLLSSSAQETLAAALFMFVKHPYDVNDRIDVWYGGSLEGQFIVQEMSLLTSESEVQLSRARSALQESIRRL